MATVIDELVVKLGLDPKGLNQGQKEALEGFRKFKGDAAKEAARSEKEEALRQKKIRDEATKTANELDAQGRKATQGFFDRLTAGALELFAVLVGAGSLEKFVAGTVTGLTNVSNAATALGLNVRDLEAFGAVVATMGGNAETAQQEMTNLARTLEQWNTLGIDPGTNFWMALNAIGGSTKDSPTELYAKLARYAETQPDKAKVSQFARFLGFGQDAETVEALKGQVAVLNDLNAAIKRTPDSADIEKVRQLGIAWKIAGQNIGGALIHFLAGAAPALTPDTRTTPLLTQGLNDPIFSGAAWSKWWAQLTGRSPPPAPAAGPEGTGLRPGVLAGLYAESRFNPNAFNASGGGQGAFGIGQWRGDRLQQLSRFAAGRGKSVSDLATQIAFVGWELTHTQRAAGAAINGAPNEAAALSAFINLYEQPGRGAAGDIQRGLAFLSSRAGQAARGAVINIGAININGAGVRDAQGVARAVGGALRSNLVAQANTGLR